MIDRLDQTIVAVSSARGHAPLGIIRLSGPDAFAVIRPLFRLPPLGNEQATAIRTSGEVCIADELFVPGFAYFFRAPRSYTKQDTVELYLPGSSALLAMVQERCIACGAEPALAGEFTARAYLNGTLALDQAEAVSGLIHAESDIQLRAARRMADGALSRQVEAIRSELAELLALVEADIDFSEEPIDFISPSQLAQRLGASVIQLDGLQHSAANSERFEQLPHVLLFGPPNAGKSTLMNRLTDTKRSICASAKGTTRDILSAPIKLPHGEAILLDSAGVDQSSDALHTLLRDATVEAAHGVDLICLVLDASVAFDDRFAALVRSISVPCIVALNKQDRLSATSEIPASLKSQVQTTPVPVSGQTGFGLVELKAVIEASLGAAACTVGETLYVMNGRQREALSTATASLRRAQGLSRESDEMIDAADVVAFELRYALDSLGTISGRIDTEDLLAHIFANFCIGK